MTASRDEYAAWVLRPGLPEHPVAPSSSYLVCGTPRCGSWLLSGLLASTGIAGRPHEWFWRDTRAANARAWDIMSFSNYVARVRDAGTTPNGVFGAKLMWAYTKEFLDDLHALGDAATDLDVIERSFPRPHFVWLRRADSVAQAVSWSIALQTGRWHRWDALESRRRARYDREQIDALVRAIEADTLAWGAWFDANRIHPLELGFDDLVADPIAVTRDVLVFLGLDADGVSIAAQTSGSSDRTHRDWIRRYLEESRRRR